MSSKQSNCQQNQPMVGTKVGGGILTAVPVASEDGISMAEGLCKPSAVALATTCIKAVWSVDSPALLQRLSTTISA